MKVVLIILVVVGTLAVMFGLYAGICGLGSIGDSLDDHSFWERVFSPGRTGRNHGRHDACMERMKIPVRTGSRRGREYLK